MSAHILDNKFIKAYEKAHGFKFSDEEKTYMLEQNYCCDHCGSDFKETMEDFVVKENRLFCDNCHRDIYLELCRMCENLDDKSAFNTYFAISKYGEKCTGLKMGIYQALEYPVFSSAVGGLGSTFIFKDNIKLLRECDIDEQTIQGAEFICDCCAEKLSKIEKKS